MGQFYAQNFLFFQKSQEKSLPCIIWWMCISFSHGAQNFWSFNTNFPEEASGQFIISKGVTAKRVQKTLCTKLCLIPAVWGSEWSFTSCRQLYYEDEKIPSIFQLSTWQGTNWNLSFVMHMCTSFAQPYEMRNRKAKNCRIISKKIRETARYDIKTTTEGKSVRTFYVIWWGYKPFAYKVTNRAVRRSPFYKVFNLVRTWQIACCWEGRRLISTDFFCPCKQGWKIPHVCTKVFLFQAMHAFRSGWSYHFAANKSHLFDNAAAARNNSHIFRHMQTVHNLSHTTLQPNVMSA